MSRLRTRIERLEKGLPKPGVINWDNLWRTREQIVPDGIVDWDALFEPFEPWSPENCPIERAIASGGTRAPNAAINQADAPAPTEQL